MYDFFCSVCISFVVQGVSFLAMCVSFFLNTSFSALSICFSVQRVQVFLHIVCMSTMCLLALCLGFPEHCAYVFSSHCV